MPTLTHTRRSTDADAAIGARIRQARVNAGLSQKVLADLTGVTCNQIHKYEVALNRVAPGRLIAIAGALNVPVSALMPDADMATPSGHERAMLEAVRAMRGLPPHHVAAVAALIHGLSAEGRA